jgi:hypothetical protein
MKSLYETDFTAWLDTQVEALKRKDFAHLDIEHLLEEMETLGGSEKSAIESHLTIIMMHMIKQHIQSERSGKSWNDSIVNARVQIAMIIEKNPSLHSYPREVFPKCYQRALKEAARQMKVETRQISGVAPWSLSEVLGS